MGCEVMKSLTFNFKNFSLIILISTIQMLVTSIFTNITTTINYIQITLATKSKVQDPKNADTSNTNNENQGSKSGKKCPPDQIFNPTRKQCEPTSGPCLGKNEVRNEKGICLIPDKVEDCSPKEVIGESARCETCPKGMAPLNGECKRVPQFKPLTKNHLHVQNNGTNNNNQISTKLMPQKNIKNPLSTKQSNGSFSVIVRVNPVFPQANIKYNAIVFLKLDAVQNRGAPVY